MKKFKAKGKALKDKLGKKLEKFLELLKKALRLIQKVLVPIIYLLQRSDEAAA